MSDESGFLGAPLLEKNIVDTCTAFAQEMGAEFVPFYHDESLWIVSKECGDGLMRQVQVSCRQIFPDQEPKLYFITTAFKETSPSSALFKTELLGVPCKTLYDLKERIRRGIVRLFLEAAWEAGIFWEESDLKDIIGTVVLSPKPQEVKRAKRTRRHS